MRGDEAERAGVGDRRNQFGSTNARHAAASNRRDNVEHLGKSGPNH
jgi:hypothetical protein